jgi:hypothetical protein
VRFNAREQGIGAGAGGVTISGLLGDAGALDKGGEDSGEESGVCTFSARWWRVRLGVVRAVLDDGWRDSLYVQGSRLLVLDGVSVGGGG